LIRPAGSRRRSASARPLRGYSGKHERFGVIADIERRIASGGVIEVVKELRNEPRAHDGEAGERREERAEMKERQDHERRGHQQWRRPQPRGGRQGTARRPQNAVVPSAEQETRPGHGAGLHRLPR